MSKVVSYTLSEVYKLKTATDNYGKFYIEDTPFGGIITTDDKTVKRYYKDGLIHRDDGPAIDTDNNFVSRRAWWKNGVDITRKIRDFCVQTGMEYDDLDELDISFIKLSFYS